MPNDIYRWENGGGLVHHCPVCQTPLTHAKARSRCLGQHVEWCKRYHTQLFRKNWSNECAPCKHSEEQHEKRHRRIADLLHQLKEAGAGSVPETPKISGARPSKPATPVSSTKKERKAVKKAAKLAEMPKMVSTADVEFVAKTMHPDDLENDEAEEERKLINDSDINLNLYFHRGTSNTRATRNAFIKRGKLRSEPGLAEAELEALMVALNVPQSSSGAKEKDLIAQIRAVIRDDMINVEKEHQQTMIRKAGFWRWASRKAYNRLVANGRVWDEKDDETGLLRRKSSAFSEESNGDPEGSSATSLQNEIETGETATKVLPPESKSGDASVSTPRMAKRRSINTTSSVTDCEWTTVGKARSGGCDGKLKLSSNGGLSKFNVKPKGMFRALGYAPADDDDDDDDDDAE